MSQVTHVNENEVSLTGGGLSPSAVDTKLRLTMPIEGRAPCCASRCLVMRIVRAGGADEVQGSLAASS